MAWIVTPLGALLVLAILRDVFHTLWHPTRHGGLSRLVMRTVWRVSAHRGSRWRPAGLAGPLGMVAVVAVWALTVAVGWGLVYWAHMPDDFSYASELAPAQHAGPVDALYFSLVTLATLGLGDIAPTSGWLRVLAPMEALVGFVLLSATVAWILGIYPALARRRTLALRLSHLRRSATTTRSLDSDGGAAILDGLASSVATVTVDFLQYAESYYFHDADEHTSLPRQLGYALALTARAAKAGHPDVRLSASVLDKALEDLAVVLDERFLRTGGEPGQVFAACARDHGHGHGHPRGPDGGRP
ncbi:two pore domain potassium channel family protein [Streptomyces sp. R302]|uniref:potassium channel family protein n=1 Tax=unclassified Streptomyces TaxID=2593676 RepID=UPI00145E8744|nr:MULTISPECIES: potassium channel family protein [unclassified Streptomyces]NML51091.1 two pore domain potassium channel family protein [Streptomyces sp. R301]NML81186.1 two pore domain potassium channel family protein [Streptomyces sp. R302]